MKRSLAAVLFASLAFAGCGSVTDSLNFKAPAGWVATPAILGRMQVWMKKAADNKQDQMLFLIRGQSANMDLKNVPGAGFGTIQSQKQSTITICGTRRAQYLSAVAAGRSGEAQSVEMISAAVGDQSYLAMYARPKSSPPDPEAEAAIRSLCPKS